jgi:ribosome-binding factor A
MSETIVQKKLAKLIQQELADILRREFSLISGVLITVRLVRVTGDLSLAKVYLSVLPDEQLNAVVDGYNEHAWHIRKALAGKIRNKVRKIPDLRFYGDDSYQVAERIDQLLHDVQKDEE